MTGRWPPDQRRPPAPDVAAAWLLTAAERRVVTLGVGLFQA
jgi:hypothetical protein